MGMTAERLAAFAELVTKERKNYKSRSEFCELVGISRTTLRALETGSQQPTLETIEKFAKALGTTAAALTGVAPTDSSPNPNPLLKDLSEEDIRVANRYHHLDAEAKHAVNAFLGTGVPSDLQERIALVIDQLLKFKNEMLPAIEDLLAAWDADVRGEEAKRPRPSRPAPPDDEKGEP